MTSTPFDLAGEHMTVEQTQTGITITFDGKGTGRICGACQLCCKLLPVPILHKAAGMRCQHSKVGKGCVIYAARPMACRTWSCRWLADRETVGMTRPDRSHYVIDVETDHVRAVPNDGGETLVFSVLQVWCDPAFPDAWRVPELRRYMLHMAEKYQLGTIVRFDSERAITIFPPPVASDREWHEIVGAEVVARDELERQVLADFGRAKEEGEA
jgi:hypothetical protein